MNELFIKIARSILNSPSLHQLIKEAAGELPELGNLSRNAVLRRLADKHVQKGNLLRASEVEGMRSAEQAGRLMAKGKLDPRAAMDGGGLLSTVSIPGIRNRKKAINMLRFAEGDGNIGEHNAKSLPADFKARFGVGANGDVNMAKNLIRPKKYGITGNEGAFEQGYGASYDAAADTVSSGNKNPLLRGMQSALGADPKSLSTINNIFAMKNQAAGKASPPITANKYI